MLALVIGTLLAISALAYVLYPMLAGAMSSPRPRRSAIAPVSAPSEGEAVAALREIEFDRVTGKLSDADYAELKSRYTARALTELRATSAANGEDAIEAAVLAYRARLSDCPRCGPRPEPDATYCSNCGTFLPGTCSTCGAAVREAGAAFCAQCGRLLAA